MGFTPIVGTYWSYWTTPSATHIATTVLTDYSGTIDLYLYDNTGAFVADLTGPGYSGGSGQWNFFGSMPQGVGDEFVITSNAGRGGTAGRDILCAASRLDMYVAPPPVGSDSNCGTETAPFATIQKGVNEVISGGTLHVAAGTYVERLTINKSLHLRGAQYGVDPTATGARTDPNSESIVDISGLAVTNPNVVIEIPSGVTNVSVDGFTLIGSPTLHYADESVIRCWDDNLAIRNNIVDGYYGVLYKGNDYLTVDKNRITANKVGVTVQPSAATYVVVSGNTIVPGAGAASDAAGIYLAGCTDCDVTGNTVTSFSGGNCVGGSSETRLEISGNTFTGCRKGINIWGSTTFVDILNNTITGCSVHGINIKGQDINILNSTITGNAIGITIDYHVLPTERVVIDHNTIMGNTTWGLEVTETVVAMVDAENNYWGTVVYSEIVPKISGDVDWSPWCNSDFLVCTYTWPVHNVTQSIDYQTIQAAVDAANSGDVIQADAGTYDEDVNVNESLTLLGAGASSTTIRGVIGGSSATITVGASDVTIAGFTITRLGNTVTEWNLALNSGRYCRPGHTSLEWSCATIPSLVTGAASTSTIARGTRSATTTSRSIAPG